MGSVIMVTGGKGPFWQLVVEGAKSAAEALDVDVKYEIPDVDENAEMQTEILSRLNLKGVDGVAISSLDPVTQSPLINRMTKDVLVVTYDSDAPLRLATPTSAPAIWPRESWRPNWFAKPVRKGEKLRACSSI